MIGLLWVGVALAAPVEGRVLQRGGSVGVEADLLWTGADGTSQQLTTAPDGRFTVDLPPGTKVQVLASGYDPGELLVPEKGPVVVLLRYVGGELEVVVEARDQDPVVFAQKLDRERVLETPGTHEDPLRLVQALPGVSQTPEYSPTAGDIAVRGSLPGDNRFYLDGIELPYLYHYNQYSSVFHTRLLDQLELYPSTFGAPWGDATGAVLDTRSVWDHPEQLRASLSANFIMGSGEVAVPLGDRWVVRASGRRSYLDLVEGNSLQYTVFPTFWDDFLRVEHHGPKGGKLALVSFGAHDDYTRYASEPNLLDPQEQSVNPELAYAQGFQVVALQHEQAGDRAHLRGSFSFTDHRLTASLPTAASDLHTRALALREDAELDLVEHLAVAAGVDLRGTQTRVLVSADRAWPEVVRESALLALGVPDDETLLRLRSAAWLEGRWSPGTLTVLPGVRVDSDSLGQDVVVDPRLGLRWRPSHNTGLRAAAGLYSQFARPEQLSAVVGDPTLAPARSAQVALGADQAIAGRLEIGLEGWYKRGWDLVVQTPGALPVGGATGDAMGLSITSRYRLREVFFAWASADFAHSTRTLDGVESPTDFDQPYAFNVVGSWTFRPTWNLGLRWRYAKGLPYTPITDGIYQSATDSYLPVLGELNGARLPDYQKVDAHVEHRIELKRATITPYAELWFVPPGNNVMYMAWSYDYDESQPVHGPGFLPLLGVRGEI